MAVQRLDIVVRTKEPVSEELPRKVSDEDLGEAAMCERERTAQSGCAWHFEIVPTERPLGEPFDFEDWLATALVDYWCSIHGGTRGE
ncbi:MAG: hypothetical protein NTW07_00785 [candidate division Zixibacteria bacterium]|nr:hypothetical protein [candidate division Zixibacteria bacterium]